MMPSFVVAGSFWWPSEASRLRSRLRMAQNGVTMTHAFARGCTHRWLTGVLRNAVLIGWHAFGRHESIVRWTEHQNKRKCHVRLGSKAGMPYLAIKSRASKEDSTRVVQRKRGVSQTTLNSLSTSLGARLPLSALDVLKGRVMPQSLCTLDRRARARKSRAHAPRTTKSDLKRRMKAAVDRTDLQASPIPSELDADRL